MGIDEVVNRIVERCAEVPENRSLLVGISGIDGCGKGYVAAQIEARLAQYAVTSAVINVDGWLSLPAKRFNRDAPAECFYESAIRFDEFFSDLVIPLRDRRSVYLVADFVEETARQYRKHVYNIRNVDVILVDFSNRRIEACSIWPSGLIVHSRRPWRERCSVRRKACLPQRRSPPMRLSIFQRRKFTLIRTIRGGLLI